MESIDLDSLTVTMETKDGHTDVASAKNQVKIARSALQKMDMELSKLSDEENLPTWWTNKVAIAVDNLDGMADYLDTQVEAVLERKMTAGEIDKREKIVMSLKKQKDSFKKRYGDLRRHVQQKEQDFQKQIDKIFSYSKHFKNINYIFKRVFK